MKELLNVYNFQDKLVSTEERSHYESEIETEFAKTGKITRKVKSIRVLLMNSQGRVYVQKRSKTKKYNAGLYDKTIGGHILHNHTEHVTLVKECAEELGIPAAMLLNDEFVDAVSSTDLTVIGIFKKVDYRSDYISIRQTPQGQFLQPFMTTFIIGYYDGAIRFCDGESSGIEVFDLEDLRAEMKKDPQRYTEDLRFIINNYSKHIVPLK